MSVAGIEPVSEPRVAAKGRTWRTFFDTRISGLCLLIVVLLAWEASARFGWIASASWPPFSAVIQAFFVGLWDGTIIRIVASTVWRTAQGYVLGVGIGIPLGLAMALARPIRRLLSPGFEALRLIPAAAIIPPLIFLLGIDDKLKIFVVVFSLVFPMSLNTMSGVAAVDPIYKKVARTFGLSGTRTLLRVIVPASAPYILAGMRTCLGLALVVTIIAEMIAGEQGIGNYLASMQYAMRPAEMYSAIIALALVAYALNRLFLIWEAHVIAWARIRDGGAA